MAGLLPEPANAALTSRAAEADVADQSAPIRFARNIAQRRGSWGGEAGTTAAA
jgi:hypothetical protein